MKTQIRNTLLLVLGQEERVNQKQCPRAVFFWFAPVCGLELCIGKNKTCKFNPMTYGMEIGNGYGGL